MKIVLTNDDGIDAPGLQALFSCLEGIGERIIVAPDKPQSGKGHGITMRGSITVDEVEKNRFSVQGTPADCTRLALKAIAPDADWLFSGINPGANLGSDVYNSGTVAAAREAAILGCRAVAISQYIAQNREVDWEITGYHAGNLLQMLLDRPLAGSSFWNVNLPHPLAYESKTDYQFCEPDMNPHNYAFRRAGNCYVYEGTIHGRPQQVGKDVAVCFGGRIAISRLTIF